MGTLFSPVPQDVERYRNLRAVSQELHRKIGKTIPRRTFEEVGDAIGIRRDGVLVFDSMDMTSVLMDCCLYDWFEDGRNLVQRYAEAHPAKPGTDEGYVLQASLQAIYRVLVVQSAVPGAGVHCRDVMNGGELFVMDLALSRSAKAGGGALATRTLPLGDYWMTSGAGLPVTSQAALDALRQLESEKRRPPRGPGMLPLAIVRACLAAGAAEYITYAETKPREPRWRPRRRRH